ncbi:hypothetical protein ABT120_00590 [Nonomuraea angiospora]|uniref:hypothetical protein n=1 Tax=Nonomuraea angiospora TaxID=46172 RepID=UPI00332DE9B2
MAGRDALTAAVIAAGRDAAGEGWDGAHRMCALTDRDTYLGVAYPLDPPAEAVVHIQEGKGVQIGDHNEQTNNFG